MRRSLEMTIDGADQPESVHSANLSVDFFPAASTQLIRTRSPSTVICGAELDAPAGEVTGSTAGPACACSAIQAAHDADSVTAAIVDVRRFMAGIGPSPHPSSLDRRRGTRSRRQR